MAPRQHRSPLTRLVVGVGAALVVWGMLPAVPREQTLIFSLGANSHRIVELSVQWVETEKAHDGGLTLSFPDGAPQRVARQFRLIDGEYEFVGNATCQVAADGFAGNAPVGHRTQWERRATLKGTTVTLRLEDLCPSAHPPPQKSTLAP